MSSPPPTLPNLADAGPFTPEQKEYLAGFFAGIAARGFAPFVGATAEGKFTHDPALAASGALGTARPTDPVNLVGRGVPTAPPEELVFGTPRSELCKQEIWKLDENPLDIWDKLIAHAEQNKFPDEADTFRFRCHGLFYVAPAQNAFMLRCRIPAGELTSAQMRGLADIADEFGAGYGDITTRSNVQIREIAPRHIVKVLTRLQELGLTARGSGVDNVRNITASPTAGIDPVELIDTRPLAKELHHYILNHRDLFGLPRKFNVAFDGGGAVSVVADTNDIGFVAVRIRASEKAGKWDSGKTAMATDSHFPTHPPAHFQETRERTEPSLRDTSSLPFAPGVHFRVRLAGITGHKQLAQDAGIIVRPDECLAVAVAMIRVFNEHGCRTDRKKARLKYLIDKWGIPKFLEETQRTLAFPLRFFPLERCELPQPPVKHGHIGVYKQAQRGRNYIGVVIPVGRMTTKQMRRLAELALNYGSGELRLTPWQNLLLPNVPDGFVETVNRSLVRMGFHHEASTIAGGLVACTGNTGCKWASTNTKGQAIELARHLEKRVHLDHPINIHLTGCPNSCAQHYIGDIGLMGVKTMLGGASVEGYNVVLGGGGGADAGIAKEVFKGIPFSTLPALLERVLTVFNSRRRTGETFAAFTRRHEVKQLQEMFSE
ncbi:MAG: precorrin-3B synthase [Verrucomicrobia bacterium]|nr:precorrin-3B synthase [Verrucomicrobiota bacterium]